MHIAFHNREQKHTIHLTDVHQVRYMKCDNSSLWTE